MIVAVKNPKCMVCRNQSPECAEAVNEAIWQGREPTKENRGRGYTSRGQRAFAAFDAHADRRTISYHATHIERSHHDAKPSDPMLAHERPVYPVDFESVTDKAALIGMRAMDVLEDKIERGHLDAKELTVLASLGVRSVMGRKTAEKGARNQNVTINAILGVASGHLTPQLSAYATIEGEYTEADLIAKVEEELEEQEALAAL